MRHDLDVISHEKHRLIGPIREMAYESLEEPLQSVADPSWTDVEAHIRRLETVVSGSVFLKAKNGSSLSIGGDRGKGYLTFISDRNGTRYLQAPSAHRSGVITLVLGFQTGEYPRQIIVDLATSLQAAHDYFHTGRISDGRDWTPDYKRPG